MCSSNQYLSREAFRADRMDGLQPGRAPGHLARMPPGAGHQHVARAADAGAPGVVVVTLSGELSATIEAARSAARAVRGSR